MKLQEHSTVLCAGNRLSPLLVGIGIGIGRAVSPPLLVVLPCVRPHRHGSVRTPSVSRNDQDHQIIAMLSAYTSFMSRRPLTGNALSMGTVVGLGDLVAQALGGQRLDMERLSVTSLYGLAAGAPFRIWLTMLERIKTLQAPTLRNAVVKTAINQCVYSPMFNSIYFAIAIARTASKAPNERCDVASLVERWICKCKADLLRTQCVATLWFFPANTMIFRLVQIEFRGVANAFAVAGFNVYLSITGNRLPSTVDSSSSAS